MWPWGINRRRAVAAPLEAHPRSPAIRQKLLGDISHLRRHAVTSPHPLDPRRPPPRAPTPCPCPGSCRDLKPLRQKASIPKSGFPSRRGSPGSRTAQATKRLRQRPAHRRRPSLRFALPLASPWANARRPRRREPPHKMQNSTGPRRWPAPAASASATSPSAAGTAMLQHPSLADQRSAAPRPRRWARRVHRRRRRPLRHEQSRRGSAPAP